MVTRRTIIPISNIILLTYVQRSGTLLSDMSLRLNNATYTVHNLEQGDVGEEKETRG